MRRADPRQGVVLVAVLWGIALLSALAMAASISFRSFAGVVAIDRDRVVTDAMLTAGIETAAGIVNSLGDMPLTDRETSVSLSSGIVRVRLSDEGGRIDINKAPIKVLASLLRSVGSGDATADSIVQGIEGWRAIVSDSPMSINVPPTPNMAGQSAAPQQPAPSTPMQTGTLAPQSSETKDVGLRAFTDTRQLALIPGMTPEYLAAIGPLTTVFGYEKINGHTASREVMTALPDLDEKQVTAFLGARENALSDDWLKELLGPAKAYVALNRRAVANIELTVNLIDGYSTKVRAVIAIIPEDTQPYRVLSWTPLSSNSSNSQALDQGGS